MQAKKEFLAEGYSENKQYESATYESHYSPALEKCLVRIESDDHGYAQGTRQRIIKLLVDSIEKRVFARYVWISSLDKKYWDVPPAWCELDQIGEPKRNCKTDDEYEAFVQKMMDN